jgi:hypothetical protein
MSIGFGFVLDSIDDMIHEKLDHPHRPDSLS